jgi:NCAIR mutase (PurE)-related protein
MNREDILTKFKIGDISLEEALSKIDESYFLDIGHTTLDLDRESRTGAPEVVFGSGKTASQTLDIIQTLVSRQANILVTRLSHEIYLTITSALPKNATYSEEAKLLTITSKEIEITQSHVAVISAGTSDYGVAEEAALTAQFYGSKTVKISDVGVAGLHRLLSKIETIRTAKVLIVVAGMEGALPSVVGGLVRSPVIAVPTSVGYGAAFEGVAALLGMLTSCASGISVVNIDNGFGAGYLANMINRL